jgi:hypothetical protein
MTSTTDLIDSAIWSLSLDDKIKVWELIEQLVKESQLPQQEISDDEIEQQALTFAKEESYGELSADLWKGYVYGAKRTRDHSKSLSDKWKEYQDWLNEPPEISDGSKDTADYIDRHIIESMKELAKEGFKPKLSEISDEEIEKAADKYVSEDDYNRYLECFKQGAKWYREQLKQKQYGKTN